MPSLWTLQLILTYFSIGLLLACSPAFGQKDRPLSASQSKELQGVLVQARDAIVELTNREAEDPGEPDTNEKKIHTLYEYLLLIDDHADVEYLRDHLSKKYAAELEPSASIPSDRKSFATLVKEIEAEDKPSQHDADLARVASQEIERGFLEDALAHAALLKASGARYQAQGQVALAAYERGKTDITWGALDAAIQSALEEDSSRYPVFQSPSRKLDQLASSFLDHNFKEGARKVILRNKQLLSTSASANGFDWRFLAEKAIELGDLELASEALGRVRADEGRSDVEDALKSARGRKMSPPGALEDAKTISDPYSRSRSLCEIAERQASSGDNLGVASTLQLALATAGEIDQFKVFALNEIAWAQIRTKDKHGAIQTLDLALKENEKHRFGSDQVDGWAILADTLAYLGQFDQARETVMKISDSFYRGRGLSFVASRAVEAGRTREIIAWSSNLSDPEDRCASFMSIAETMIEKMELGPLK